MVTSIIISLSPESQFPLTHATGVANLLVAISESANDGDSIDFDVEAFIASNNNGVERFESKFVSLFLMSTHLELVESSFMLGGQVQT